MNLTGKLTRILPLENGTSKAGKDWQKQSFVLEYQDGNYSKLACIQVKNEIMIGLLKKFKVGDTLSCEVKIEAREWQDRFYTDVTAWRISKAEENVDNLF